MSDVFSSQERILHTWNCPSSVCPQGKHAGGQKALWIAWTAEVEQRLGGQASFDPRMISLKSLCKLQGKPWEQVINWCLTEGHEIYRLRRGTTLRFYVLPQAHSLPC